MNATGSVLPLDPTNAPLPLVLFGGSFDPVHNGHLRAALDAATALEVPQVTLLPAGAPALRNPLAATSAQRLKMLHLAIADDPALAVDDRELNRAGTTYTVETLSELRRLWPERALIFLLGADAFGRIEAWRDWRQLLSLAHLGVLTRPGEIITAPQDRAFQQAYCNDPSQLRRRPFGRWTAIAVTPMGISASAIRELLAKQRSARFLLPDVVLEFAHAQRLYRRKTS